MELPSKGPRRRGRKGASSRGIPQGYRIGVGHKGSGHSLSLLVAGGGRHSTLRTSPSSRSVAGRKVSTESLRTQAALKLAGRDKVTTGARGRDFARGSASSGKQSSLEVTRPNWLGKRRCLGLPVSSHALLQTKTYETNTAALACGLCPSCRNRRAMLDAGT